MGNSDIQISAEDVNEMNFARSKLIKPSCLTIQTNANVIDTKLEHISIMKTSEYQQYCLSCKLFALAIHNLEKRELALNYLKTF